MLSHAARYAAVIAALAAAVPAFPMASSYSTYTGQQLFQGIFLGTGPAAGRLPEFWNAPLPTSPPPSLSTRTGVAAQFDAASDFLSSQGMAQEAQVLANMSSAIADPNQPIDLTPKAQSRHPGFQAALLADIQAADSSFFARFGRDIQSGQQTIVAGAVREATRLVLDVMDPASPGSELIMWESVAVWIYRDHMYAVAIDTESILVLHGGLAPAGFDGQSNLEFDWAVQLVTARFGPVDVPALPGRTGLLLGFAMILALTLLLARRGRRWA